MFAHVGHETLKTAGIQSSHEGKILTPDGIRFPSVTRVLSVSADKKGIEEWRKMVGEEEADRIAKRAAHRGQTLHTLTEKYMNNDPNWSEGFSKWRMMGFETIRKLLENRVSNIWCQEAALWSYRLKTSGRVDLIADFDSVLSVIDFKISTKKKRREHVMDYFRQEAFYAEAFFELTGIDIEQLVTIVAVEHDQPQVFVERKNDHLRDFMKIRYRYFKINGE